MFFAFLEMIIHKCHLEDLQFPFNGSKCRAQKANVGKMSKQDSCGKECVCCKNLVPKADLLLD